MNDSPMPPSHWERVARELAYIDGTFPIDAVFEARDYWPEVREAFLTELVLAIAVPDSVIDAENALPIYAMFLAAEKRDAAFASPILDLMKLPPDVIDALFGETTLTEGVGRCLASVWQGSDEPIRALAFDESHDMFVRMAAIEAMVVRAIEGDANLDLVAEFVFSLAKKSAIAAIRTPARGQRKPPRKDYDPFFNMLLSTLADLGASQYWSQIEQWGHDGSIDPMSEDIAGLRKAIFSSRDARLARMFKPYYVRDTVEELSWWACFNEPEPPETYVRAQPKVGRNDSCPCGSGKKFKKCCGAGV